MSTYWRPHRPRLDAYLRPKPPSRQVSRPGVVFREATVEELSRFRWLAVNVDKTQVIGVTKDFAAVEPFGEWREYVRDRKTGAREFEVTFDQRSVPNALKVIDSRQRKRTIRDTEPKCICRNFGPVEHREREPRCPLHGDHLYDA